MNPQAGWLGANGKAVRDSGRASKGIQVEERETMNNR